MKILALRLDNLASLAGTHEVDFEKAPLSDAGLFAITIIGLPFAAQHLKMTRMALLPFGFRVEDR